MASYPTANRNIRFFHSETSVPDFINAFKAEEMDVDEKVLLLLTFIGEEVVMFLRSYVDKSKPIDRRSVPSHPLQQPGMPRPEPITGTRNLHPGGWADITGDLMRKYKFRVENDGDSWRLSIINNSEHAAFVEAMSGLFVVHGVMEPGGPVEKALRDAIRRLAPGWQISSYSGTLGEMEEFVGALHSSATVLPGDDQ